MAVRIVGRERQQYVPSTAEIDKLAGEAARVGKGPLDILTFDYLSQKSYATPANTTVQYIDSTPSPQSPRPSIFHLSCGRGHQRLMIKGMAVTASNYLCSHTLCDGLTESTHPREDLIVCTKEEYIYGSGM